VIGLDAMRDLLLTRDWSATRCPTGRAAGISRQTIYNEFGSRGLGEATLCAWPIAWVGTVHAGPERQRRQTSTNRSCRVGRSSPRRRQTPLVISLLTGVAKPDCCSSSPPTAHPSSPRVWTACDGIHPNLGRHQRRRRHVLRVRSCGVVELRVDCRRGRPRCRGGSGPLDDAFAGVMGSTSCPECPDCRANAGDYSG